MDRFQQAVDVTRFGRVSEAFGRRQMGRFLHKQADGYTGWDDEEQISASDLLHRMSEKIANHVGNADDMADVANMALMVWMRCGKEGTNNGAV